MKLIDADKFLQALDRIERFHRQLLGPVHDAIGVTMIELKQAVSDSTVDPSRARVTPIKRRKKR